MKRAILILTLLVTLSLACSLSGLTDGGDEALPQNQSPPQSENRCGDGICDKPENTTNCPDDCTESAPEAEAAASGSVCNLPNPQRAVVSEELLVFENFYEDGSFEQGSAEIVISEHSQALAPAAVERSPKAAHTGEWGYLIEAGPGEGTLFALKGYVEKGEDIRFSAWVRSPQGNITLKPLIFWIESENNLGQPTLGQNVTIGSEWTQVEILTSTKQGIEYALFAFEVGPNTTLHIDDVQIELPLWRMAEYEGESQVIGGVTVPPEPAAVTHINFVIHIEDPNALQNNRAYFESQSAIFTELARIFHEHGGFLTIQPEQDWPIAAENGFHPGLLAELAENYGVQYSNHTHGPNCIDDKGLARSSADCNTNQNWGRAFTKDDIVAYAQNLRLLLEEASGIPVTDHNGNFDFTQSSRFAEAGIQTLSVYKNKTTQRTYDYLYNNPWRPGQGDALKDLENFLTHDPDAEIVYIPGWGQALTRHPERAAERIRPMLSQFIRYADPDRVNTFYVVLHIGHFYSRSGDRDYIAYNDQTGQISYSDEFLTHIQYWDDLLTEVVDPLVEAGYLQWTSIPEIGELYRNWESTCGE